MNAPRRKLLALVVLSFAVQTLHILRAPVPAQDCVRYVAAAQSLSRNGLAAFLAQDPETPIFPALILLVRDALLGSGLAGPAQWAWAAQWAAALPLILAIVPLLAVLRSLVGETSAVVGACLFCMLRPIAGLGASGLADSTHLLVFVTAIWASVRAFDSCQSRFGRQSALWFVATGALAGIGMWCRPESFVVVPACACASLWCCRSAGRILSLPVIPLCVVAGLSLTLLPYLAASGCQTWRDAARRIRGASRSDEAPLNVDQSQLFEFRKGGASTAWECDLQGPVSLARKDSSSSRLPGNFNALADLCGTALKSLNFWLIPLILGLLRQAARSRRAEDVCVFAVAAIYLPVLIATSATTGYLSSRHLLPLFVSALPAIGEGSTVLIESLAGMLRRFDAAGRRVGFGRLVCRTSLRPTVLLIAALPGVVIPLHRAQANHRSAAEWVAAKNNTPCAVLDTRGYSSLYSGLCTYRYELAREAFADPALRWLVFDDREIRSNTARAATLRQILAIAAQPVARFGRSEECVVVYRWDPDRFANWRHQAHAA